MSKTSKSNRNKIRTFVAAPEVTSATKQVNARDVRASTWRGILWAIGTFTVAIWDFSTDLLYGAAGYAIPWLQMIPKADTPYIIAALVFLVIGVLSLIQRWKAPPQSSYHYPPPMPPMPPMPPTPPMPPQHYPNSPYSPPQYHQGPPDYTPPAGPSAFD